MEINEQILKYEPSRHSVYELLAYFQGFSNIKLKTEEKAGFFLVKTEPYLDSLYNYAHFIGQSLSASDLKSLSAFFEPNSFRVKIPVEKDNPEVFLAQGFKFKDLSCSMQAAGLKEREIDLACPEEIRISSLSDEKSWTDFKNIFCEAFEKREEEYEAKFGFLKKLLFNKTEKHLRFFLVYENNIPLSAGAYYAFDKFSIENIGTLKIARGRGLAGLMLRFLLLKAKELGYDEACLVASQEAKSLYQKLGFAVLSESNTYIK